MELWQQLLRRESKRRNENKTEKKKKSVVLCAWLFLSFTPTPQLLTVGCVMCCTNRKRDREFRSGVGRSVGNADDVERTNDSCVLSLRWCCCCCWLVTTTLSIFSLHVGLFSARYPAHSSCALSRGVGTLLPFRNWPLRCSFLLWNWPVGSSCVNVLLEH